MPIFRSTDLLKDIKAFPSVETTFTATTPTLLPVEPTAIDIEEKDDIIAQKIAQEEAQAQAAVEKRAALVALHDMYDVEIEKLGQTELKLLAERLTSLRSAALRDIPVRFDLALQNYKLDCDKWVSRVEKCKYICLPFSLVCCLSATMLINAKLLTFFH